MKKIAIPMTKLVCGIQMGIFTRPCATSFSFQLSKTNVVTAHSA